MWWQEEGRAEEMKKWKSHKIVEAGKITTLEEDVNTGETHVHLFLGNEILRNVPAKVFARGKPEPGDYMVRYEDGYLSWSPAKAFEDGYTEVDSVG